jgi:hypothetical protein
VAKFAAGVVDTSPQENILCREGAHTSTTYLPHNLLQANLFEARKMTERIWQKSTIEKKVSTEPQKVERKNVNR